MIRDVEVRDAGAKGNGVFARRAFKRGEFIFRRRHGRIVDAKGIAQLSPEEQMHLCELDWDRFAVLEPPGCYLNHSCDPNAMRSGVKVFAWTSIRAGDEITIDYRLNAFDGSSWPCDCGTAACSDTVVGSFFALPQDRQRAYLRYAPPFIRREYHRRARGLAPLRRAGGPHMTTYPPLDIVPHWGDLNEHLIELAAAVPADKWNWSPEPRMWNFRGIFLHIIAARYFTSEEAPDFWREGQTINGLQEHLRSSWARLATSLLTPEALAAPAPSDTIEIDPESPDGHYFAWHRMVHDIHHRADILHYLDVLQVDLSIIPRRRPL